MGNIGHGGALAFLVMIFDACSDHLMFEEGIPSMLRMLLIGLDWKGQMNSRILVFCTSSDILRRYDLTVG